MAESKTKGSIASRITSTPGIPWVAGLVVSVILSFVLSLIVVAVTNAWVSLFLLALLGLILAVAVGFAVRLTSSGPGAFWPAAVTAGLGVHVVTALAGVTFHDYGSSLLAAFQSAPLSAYVVFYGVIAGVVATFARRP
jgi:hypothetical protein